MKIRKTYLLSTLCVGVIANIANGAPNNTQEEKLAAPNHAALVQQSQQKIATFAKTLKQALTDAIQAKGFNHAVDICKTTAPKIAKQLSGNGWSVSRTSLKVRNPKNQPDEWETKILTAFDAAYKAGKAGDSLTATHTTKNTFRYMKAIPTAQLCLTCHGQQIDAQLLKTIKKHYPEDSATGFTLDDIRGAFTVEKTL